MREKNSVDESHHTAGFPSYRVQSQPEAMPNPVKKYSRFKTGSHSQLCYGYGHSEKYYFSAKIARYWQSLHIMVCLPCLLLYRIEAFLSADTHNILGRDFLS